MWQGLFKRPPDTDIKLDPHQRDAIERLEKLHPDQHGLILFHFLGSGKTITALSFAMNYPTKQLCVVCPPMLKLVWKMELKKLKLTRSMTVISIFDILSAPTSTYKGCILVIDEAHNILKMRAESTVEEGTRLLDAFVKVSASAHRTLLLTGTPIWKDITDISVLSNIAIGKFRFPMSTPEFYKMYGVQSASFNQVRHDIDIVNRSSFSLTEQFKNAKERPLTTALMAYNVVATVHLGLTVVNKGITAVNNYFSPNDEEHVNKKGDANQETIDTIDIAGTLLSKHETLQRKYRNLRSSGTPNVQTGSMDTNANEHQKWADRDRAIKHIGRLHAFLNVMTFIVNADSELRREKMLNSTHVENVPYEKAYEIDMDKALHAMRQYMDYYDQFASPLESGQAVASSPYASKHFNVRAYMYSRFQADSFYELMAGMASESLARFLGHTLDIGFFKIAMESPDVYKRCCMQMSNLSPLFLLRTQKAAHAKNDCFEFSVPVNAAEIDNPKFKFILDLYRKGNRKTVLYSSFVTSYQKTSAWLTSMGVAHYVLDTIPIKQHIIDAFNRSADGFLILAPSIYEGLSLLGVRVLHLLEPISISVIRTQLLGRVVRKGSHSHLAANERQVDIYDHVFHQPDVLVPLNEDTSAQVMSQIKRFNGVNDDKERLRIMKEIRNPPLTIRTQLKNSLKHLSSVKKLKELYQKWNLPSDTGEQLSRFVDGNLGDVTKVIYANGGLRSRFFYNPDFETYQSCIRDQSMVTKLLTSLTIKHKEDGHTLQRECDIWTPSSSGTCAKMNSLVK